MKYILTVRKIEEDEEMSPDCFMEHDENKLEMYLTAFAEEIEKIDLISNVKHDEFLFDIETSNSITESELEKTIKQCISNKTIKCYLKFVSLTQDPNGAIT